MSETHTFHMPPFLLHSSLKTIITTLRTFIETKVKVKLVLVAFFLLILGWEEFSKKSTDAVVKFS